MSASPLPPQSQNTTPTLTVFYFKSLNFVPALCCHTTKHTFTRPIQTTARKNVKIRTSDQFLHPQGGFFRLIGMVRTLLTDLLTLSQKENFIGTVVTINTGYYGINCPRILIAEYIYMT